jgi:hypothetical protein
MQNHYNLLYGEMEAYLQRAVFSFGIFARQAAGTNGHIKEGILPRQIFN